MILLFAIGLFLVRILYSAGEIYFEHDWPRHTWRGLVTSGFLVAMCITVFG